MVLRFRKIDQTDLVYIYITYDSIAKFSPRLSADGHILVKKQFHSNHSMQFGITTGEKRTTTCLMITKGRDQLVLSVQGGKEGGHH